MTSVVLVEISESGADPERLDQLSRRLLKDLRELGLDAERPTGRAPAGAKSGTAVALMGLVVAFAGTPAMTALVNGLFNWLGPRRGSVKISCGDRSIELSSATPAEGQRLYEWLRTCDQQAQGPDGEGPGE